MKKSSLSAIAAAFAFGAILVAGCKFGFLEDSDNTPAVQAPVDEALSLPVASPQGGSYSEGYKQITLTTATPDALIYYTDNGTIPNLESNRYNEPINIYGSKTIKAVAVKGGKISQVMTAAYTLNSGREANKLGIVKGRVALPEGNKTLMSDVSIYSDDIPGVINHPDDSGFFIFDGLDTSKRYTFYFTNQEVGVIREKDRSVVSAARNTTGIGGQPIVARKVTNVEPALGAGINLLDILLKQTGSITGTVNLFNRAGTLETDHGGVDVYVPGTSFTAKTDSAGKFTLQYLPEGLYNIRASKPDYTFREIADLTVAANAVTLASAEPLKITYGYGTVTGTVFLLGSPEQDATFEGVSVVISSMNDATFSLTASTNAAGVYTLTNVEPGLYTALYSKDGFSTQSVEMLSVSAARTTIVDSVSLTARGGSVTGSVPVKGETDLAGTILVAKNALGKTYSTATDSSGNFTFKPVTPGAYTITASRIGFTTRSIENISVEIGQELTGINFLEMVPTTGSVNGTVLLEGALSFEGIAVTLRKSDDPAVSKSATTDTTGTYIFSDVKPGTYLVTFARDGYLSGTGTQVTLAADGIASAESVTLLSGKARLGGTATLESASDHSGISILASAGETTYNTVTDANGRWMIVGMDPGTYTMQATRDGYTASRSDPVVLGAGSVHDTVVQSLAVSSRSLVGTVTLEGRSVYSGTKVTATNLENPSLIYSALTNDQGRFVLAGMIPGGYILSYSRENYRGITTNEISLATTSSVTLDAVEMTRATGTVSGIVKKEGRSAHANIAVTLLGTEYATTTDADGVYSFTVPSANYPGGVRFECEDFETTADTETITVLTDSTYGVQTHTIRATHNSIAGQVDLLGTDDDAGIAVTIDGTEISTTTAAEGVWSLAHLPMGSYTVRFSKLNTPDVTVTVEIGASEPVQLGRLEMIPNAASLKGKVTLQGLTSHANISVSVTTEGKSDSTALSSASGTFEVNNILSTGSHTVTFSKDGWNPVSFVINDFQPLEVRTVGMAGEYELTDTTAPTLSAVLINNGSNFTNSKTVSIQLTLLEQGSGADKMQVRLNGNPTEPNWESYSGSINRALDAIFPTAYTGNGDYTVSVRVKDKAGNISAWMGDSITVTDQTKVVAGVLTGEDLHWTKAKSPYRVEGNLLVEAGQTLIIDPGVEVRFAGAYYLQVEGSISAVGTASDKILFSTASDFTGAWQSIRFVRNTSLGVEVDSDWNWISGPCFQYATFEGVSAAFSAGSSESSRPVVFADQCVFHCSVGASNYFPVVILNSEAIDILPFGLIRNVVIANASGRAVGTYRNVEIRDSQSIGLNGDMQNVSIINATTVTFSYGNYNGMMFENIASINFDDGFMELSIRFSCFSNIGTIATGISKTPTESTIDLCYNDWGSAWTQELDTVGLNANKSFIHDYYDDFNLVKFDLTGYLPAGSLANTGYNGSTFVNVDASGMVVGTNASIGTTVHDATGAEIRTSLDFTALSSASWQPYASSVSVVLGSAPTDREVPVWVQVKDQDGNLSVPLGVICPVYDFVAVTGGSSDSVPNGTANGTWSVSDFSIGIYEVTQAQYSALMGKNPSSFRGDVNRPVENVSWYDAVEFCNKLSAITGKTPAYTYVGYGTDPAAWPAGWKDEYNNNISCDWTASGYRLPTEAEWEWASRGGNQSLGYTYAGSNTEGDVAWYTGNSSTTVHAVGTKASNELGLYDMSGNVWEWCWDWYGASMTGTDPVGAASGSSRVIRGGGWYGGAGGLGVANREGNSPGSRGYNVGFRLVLPAVQE